MLKVQLSIPDLKVQLLALREMAHRVVPVGPAIGAEILGVDPAHPSRAPLDRSMAVACPAI